MVGCGDIPTKEALAATTLLRIHFLDLKIRFINVIDRFSFAIDVINRVSKLTMVGSYAKQLFRYRQIEYRHYAHENGVDLPEENDWI